MENQENRKAFYDKLKSRLEETTKWPSLYLYKFIVPTDEDKIKEVETMFDNMGAVINTKKSTKGTYTSISISLKMESPEAVIEKYQEAEKVEGIISL
ncbi:hypothetical protein SAMN04487906_1976 [Zhouia amylolytica]|uniref:DUF493 domain-containing protein n=2 Tax=Zhouia amylolytica TaxID=376730 RepID=W2US61_9FLAO|nr:DUF493 family protein [Zhouia amylolytica]ETN96301.1 hypothetical protein P278_08120 [Zhouia amylolytica AD3]MCQ0112209.1 DUF493 family protein [Zhouia amylolytica]SFS87003.1 hypothetical protein SAMN04487906_1976 [Zhouia amylolytica]